DCGPRLFRSRPSALAALSRLIASQSLPFGKVGSSWKTDDLTYTIPPRETMSMWSVRPSIGNANDARPGPSTSLLKTPLPFPARAPSGREKTTSPFALPCCEIFSAAFADGSRESALPPPPPRQAASASAIGTSTRTAASVMFSPRHVTDVGGRVGRRRMRRHGRPEALEHVRELSRLRRIRRRQGERHLADAALPVDPHVDRQMLRAHLVGQLLLLEVDGGVVLRRRDTQNRRP